MTARTGDGTVWTSYENDDRAFWRQLRRELVEEGYHSSVLRKYKELLKDYVEELGRRGVFDQINSEEDEKIEGDEESEEDFPLEAKEPQDDSQESMEPEEEESDGVEFEGSEPEDFNPLPLNDEPEQPAKRAWPEILSEPANPNVDRLSPNPTFVQTLDTLAPPMSSIEPSLELSSPVDEPPSSPNSPISQPQNVTDTSNESATRQPVLSQAVHVEDTLDEDLVPVAHPNCFTDAASETPGKNIQKNSSNASVTSRTPPDILNSQSYQEPDMLSGNHTRDFILLSSVTEETSSAPGIDEVLELPSDSKNPKQRVRKRQESEKQDVLNGRRITFKDPKGFAWTFPFFRVKTWAVSASSIFDTSQNC
jgi:hypothetical protein